MEIIRHEPKLCCLVNPINCVARRWHRLGKKMCAVREIYKIEVALFCRSCYDLPENKKFKGSSANISGSHMHSSRFFFTDEELIANQ